MKAFLFLITRVLAVVIIGFGSVVAHAAPTEYMFSGFIPYNGLSISGSFSLNTDSTLPMSGSGIEGTTTRGTLSLALSDGNTVTASRNWYSVDSGGIYLLASIGDAYVSGGSILGYYYPAPSTFSLSGDNFSGLIFQLPHSLPANFLSSNAPLNLSGISGQLGVGDMGLTISNLDIAPVPEPEAYAMLLAGLGFMGIMARRRRQQPAV